MAGSLETNPDPTPFLVQYGIPGFVGKRDELLTNFVQELFDQALVSGKADFEGVFDDQRQKLGGGFGAVDGPFKARGHQVGQAADVVDMDVGDHEREDAVQVEANPVLFEAVDMVGVLPLKQTAVHEHGAAGAGDIAVAATGDAIGAAVVEKLWVVSGHRLFPLSASLFPYIEQGPTSRLAPVGNGHCLTRQTVRGSS